MKVEVAEAIREEVASLRWEKAKTKIKKPRRASSLIEGDLEYDIMDEYLGSYDKSYKVNKSGKK